MVRELIMGQYNNPKVSVDQLRFYLDAANTYSYPGSGNKWNDISGNGLNYNMIGSVPIAQSGSTTYFDFSGNNNSDPTPRSYNAPLGFSAPANMDGMGLTRTGSFTISYWFRHNGAGGQISLIANAGSADGFRFGPSSNGYYWLMGLAYREGIAFTGAASGDGNWHYVNGVFDRANEYGRSGGASVHMWQDGQYLGDVGNFGTQTTMQGTGPGISRNPCCLRFAGDCSLITWHNKALTADEVAQNYYAHRARFQGV